MDRHQHRKLDPDPHYFGCATTGTIYCCKSYCSPSVAWQLRIRIRDEQPGSYFRQLRRIFWVKILKFFDADPGWEKILIRDPQHWFPMILPFLNKNPPPWPS
jgi:hypothetical protein